MEVDQTPKYQFIVKATMIIFIASLVSSILISEFDLLISPENEMVEFFDLTDPESEKEEYQEEKEKESKLRSELGYHRTGILSYGDAHFLFSNSYSLFHPEISTPPPESFFCT